MKFLDEERALRKRLQADLLQKDNKLTELAYSTTEFGSQVPLLNDEIADLRRSKQRLQEENRGLQARVMDLDRDKRMLQAQQKHQEMVLKHQEKLDVTSKGSVRSNEYTSFQRYQSAQSQH